jgi:hypothetical protein
MRGAHSKPGLGRLIVPILRVTPGQAVSVNVHVGYELV